MNWIGKIRFRPLAAVLSLLALSAPSAGAQSTNAPSRLSYDSFRMISDRNIFNPNRYSRSTGQPTTRPTTSRPPSRVEYFTLTGTLAYEKGVFAFFDGSNSEYRKALQAGTNIGHYQLINIDADKVVIVDGTNHIELKVGMQMRREDEGDWFLTAPSEQSPRRVVSTRARTHSYGGGANGTGEGGDGMAAEGDPEVIVIDSASLNGGEFQNGTATEAAPGNAGPTDPVLLRLMQRREQLNQ